MKTYYIRKATFKNNVISYYQPTEIKYFIYPIKLMKYSYTLYKYLLIIKSISQQS